MRWGSTTQFRFKVAPLDNFVRRGSCMQWITIHLKWPCHPSQIVPLTDLRHRPLTSAPANQPVSVGCNYMCLSLIMLLAQHSSYVVAQRSFITQHYTHRWDNSSCDVRRRWQNSKTKRHVIIFIGIKYVQPVEHMPLTISRPGPRKNIQNPHQILNWKSHKISSAHNIRGLPS